MPPHSGVKSPPSDGSSPISSSISSASVPVPSSKKRPTPVRRNKEATPRKTPNSAITSKPPASRPALVVKAGSTSNRFRDSRDFNHKIMLGGRRRGDSSMESTPSSSRRSSTSRSTRTSTSSVGSSKPLPKRSRPLHTVSEDNVIVSRGGRYKEQHNSSSSDDTATPPLNSDIRLSCDSLACAEDEMSRSSYARQESQRLSFLYEKLISKLTPVFEAEASPNKATVGSCMDSPADKEELERRRRSSFDTQQNQNQNINSPIRAQRSNSVTNNSVRDSNETASTINLEVFEECNNPVKPYSAFEEKPKPKTRPRPHRPSRSYSEMNVSSSKSDLSSPIRIGPLSKQHS